MTNAEQRIPAPAKPRVRWGIAAGSIVGGLVALAGAWVFGTQSNPFGLGLDENSTAFWSGLLLNVGTTIALAFLLIAFERIIITEVRREGAAAIRLAKTTAEEVAGDVVDAKLAPIELRLNDFDATLKERAAQRQNDRLQAASNVKTDTSFEAFAAALKAAAEINAITEVPGGIGTQGDSQIIVPAGRGFDAPRVEITHIQHASNGSPHIAFSLQLPSFADRRDRILASRRGARRRVRRAVGGFASTGCAGPG